jgi:23S rRNA pseudouridine2605 synthase
MSEDRRPPLVRALSKLGLASRSEARALVAAGRVRVNGVVVTDGARRVSLTRDRVAIDGAVPAAARSRRIVLFHKPRGVITTRRDPDGRQTVFDLLGDAAEGLIAVGRLDRASTGLLVLTNDNALADALTDPRHHVPRRYVVTVRGRVTPDTATRIESGIEVAGERGDVDRLHARSVVIRKTSNRESHLIVELVEGRNREIRRLFSALGHEVTRVHRVSFGPFALGDLQAGKWAEVDPAGGT